MELIKLGYEVSKPVTEINEILADMLLLKKFIIEADKKRQCYAIHHAQVHPHPFNFFVVHPRYCLGDGRLFEHNVIINPTIIESVPYLRPTWEDYKRQFLKSGEDEKLLLPVWQNFPARLESQLEWEGCMSFPFRKPKKVERFVAVKVWYQNEKLELITTTLEGPAAHVFQHETDHGAGKNIYFSR